MLVPGRFRVGMHNSLFCKTNKAAYDVVVCEVLLLLAYFYDLDIESDAFRVTDLLLAGEKANQGIWDNGSWWAAIDNMEEIYGLPWDLIMNPAGTELELKKKTSGTRSQKRLPKGE